MLKKVVFFTSIVIIMSLCIYSIFLMYQTDTKYEVSIDPNELYVNKSDDEIYIVKAGNVIQTITIIGTVAPCYEEERIEVFIESAPDKIEECVEAGDILEENQVYARCDGYEHKAESKMRCVSVKTEENGILFVFIDYDKLYIDVNIPEKYAEESLYNKNVIVKNKKLEFSGKISYIDAYCMGGTVNSRIEYKNEEILLRPGTECNVSIVLDQKENVVAVPLEYVIYSEYEDRYMIILSDGKKSMTAEIKAGVIGDEMVEIISGVSENDSIILPAFEKSLKYYLSNN